MSLLKSERIGYKPFEYDWCYRAYKQQQQMHWLPDEVPMADDIKDWNSKLTKEEKNLLTQIFRFFTQCYDEQTEVLTSSGWKYFKDISFNDKVAQVTKDNIVEFVLPEAIHKSFYSGEMYHFKDGRNYLDLLVTPNHKMVYKRGGKFHTCLAKDFKSVQNVKIVRSSSKIGDINSLNYYDRLKIAFQADGHLHKETTGERLGYFPHYFAFKKQRKVKRLENILSILKIPYTKSFYDDYTQFRVECQERLSKTFSWVNLESISSVWAQEFLYELHNWDGNVNSDVKETRYTYSNTNLDAINIVQAIVSLSGYYHGFFADNATERSDKFNTCYRVSWIRRFNAEVDGQAIARNSKLELYTGNVYCVTVPTGMLLVRRNNKIAICGNSDIEIQDCYITRYASIFKPVEVKMMLGAFSNMESVHIDAYSYLLDTIGMPEVEYSAFMQYKEMKAKHDFLSTFKTKRPDSIAKTLATFGAFTEGLSLFASFAMLLNFPRFNKMKGMGQIVTWSLRDETLHCENIIKLFHTFVRENKDEIDKDKLHEELIDILDKIVKQEDAFIDLAFELGAIEGMTADDIKKYIRYIADRRLLQLKYKTHYKVKHNPLPWLEEILNGKEHGNFFETRVTEYSKSATTGTWNEAFA